MQKRKSKFEKMCHVRCTSILLIAEVLSRIVVKPDPYKLQALPEVPAPKKDLQTF